MSEAFIPLSVPHIRGREWDYVKECLDGEWVSSAGPFVDRFEKEFAAYVGGKHAVACASGSASLHLALMLAGVKAGEIVIVPSLTFIASVNVISYCGAEPFFLDSDAHYNLDHARVADFLRNDCRADSGGLEHKKSGKRVAAILPVHIFGNAVHMEPLLTLAEEFGLPIIEDAAESLGTRYKKDYGKKCAGKHTGTLGRIGCFSFNGNKIITTGGGGMLVTDDGALAERARYLSTQAKNDEARFVHHEVGYNYRLTNVQAAIGSAQLEKMDEYLQKKKEIFEAYRTGLRGVKGLFIAPAPEFAENNHWMPCLQVNKGEYGEDREELMRRLGEAKIQARPVWELNHRQKPFANCGRGDLDGAEKLHALTLNLPCSVGLSSSQQDRVIKELRRGR